MRRTPGRLVVELNITTQSKSSDAISLLIASLYELSKKGNAVYYKVFLSKNYKNSQCAFILQAKRRDSRRSRDSNFKPLPTGTDVQMTDQIKTGFEVVTVLFEAISLKKQRFSRQHQKTFSVRNSHLLKARKTEYGGPVRCLRQLKVLQDITCIEVRIVGNNNTIRKQAQKADHWERQTVDYNVMDFFRKNMFFQARRT